MALLNPPDLWLVALGTLVACTSGADARQAATEPVAAPTPPAAQVSFSPSAVTLNYATGEMEIRGRLAREPRGEPPKHVWVWAYFMNPTESFDGDPVGGSRSDEPIELANPFGAGDTVRIVARGPFHWATRADVPKTGYYARVSVSGRSAEDARVPVKRRDYRREHAVRVATKR